MQCVTPTTDSWALMLTSADRKIAQIVGTHGGAAKPITIDQIATEMFGPPNAGRKTPEIIQREIKATVRRLRRAGYKIGARRGPNPGFFMIENSRELADTIRPLLRQAVDQLRTIEALTGHDYFTRELAGQLRLFAEEETR